jgi:hypothetical protein
MTMEWKHRPHQPGKSSTLMQVGKHTDMHQRRPRLHQTRRSHRLNPRNFHVRVRVCVRCVCDVKALESRQKEYRSSAALQDGTRSRQSRCERRLPAAILAQREQRLANGRTGSCWQLPRRNAGSFRANQLLCPFLACASPFLCAGQHGKVWAV